MRVIALLILVGAATAASWLAVPARGQCSGICPSAPCVTSAACLGDCVCLRVGPAIGQCVARVLYAER